MKMTFRWFGEKSDNIPLKFIRQIPNCSGIVGVLDQYAAGEVWPLEVIQEYVKNIHQHGLEVEVIESVNVHEDIKLGLASRDRYIENYIQTIKNLARCGIKVIIYNFMPVFDWLRTDLSKEIKEDGSNSLYYDNEELEGLTPQMLVYKTTTNSKGFSLPGWEPERLTELEEVLNLYKDIDEEKLLQNYKYFLEAIIPICEEVGVRMAVHPDDPAWPVFGIPRIAHTKEQLDKIVNLVDSSANSICLCTGSLGSSSENDIPSIIRYFGKKQRIACAHVRNLKRLGKKKFRESSHFSADGDLDMFEIMRAIYETTPDIYIRPDHGRMIWNENGRPGYGLYDRALGIAYLNGIWESLEKLLPIK